MKHIKIVFLITTIIITYIIYIFTNNNKINYLVLGDSLSLGKTPYSSYDYGYKVSVKETLENQNLLNEYNDIFTDEYITIKELTEDIKSNITKENTNIKKQLRESDLVTLSIGNQELEKIINPFIIELEGISFTKVKDHLDEIITDLDKLFQEMKRYAVNQVIFIGFYNLYPYHTEEFEEETTKILDYLISNTKTLTVEYNIEYIDTQQLFINIKEYVPNPYNYYPNNKGYELISTEISQNLAKLNN